MTEPDRAPLRWRGNIHRAVAWLRAPSDGEDQASFQLDVIWSNGVERLPEVYALERSNPCFEVAWSLLRTALTLRLNVLIVPAGPGHVGSHQGGWEGAGAHRCTQGLLIRPHDQGVLR
jgi:hypothetical protein